jgi:phytoene dehydrogenase-like protein
MVADVIVIGGGWGGLTTAAILAHNGLEVQMLEATGHLGGRSTCDRKDGFIVDYGIHIISYASEGPAAKALQEIGYDIEFLSYGKPQLYIDGEFSQMPTGVSSFLSSHALSWADKMIIGHGVRKLIVSNTARIADKPLAEVIPGSKRESVREFYKILSSMGLIAPDIDLASAGEFAKFLRRAMRAREQVSYPRGGSSQINDALAGKIRESGTISFNSRVKALQIEGGRVKSVKVHEDELNAKAVVLAIPVQKLPELVGSALDDEFKKKCASLVPTAGISIDLCLDEVVSDMDSCFITADPVTMGQFTSNIDPSTAPEGKQLATFFYPLPLEVLEDPPGRGAGAVRRRDRGDVPGDHGPRGVGARPQAQDGGRLRAQGWPDGQGPAGRPCRGHRKPVPLRRLCRCQGQGRRRGVHLGGRGGARRARLPRIRP